MQKTLLDLEPTPDKMSKLLRFDELNPALSTFLYVCQDQLEVQR
jgi:hypothetical protein